jgi:hypothetical protein
MAAKSAEQTCNPWFHSPNFNAGKPASTVSIPLDFSAPRRSTGTEDDDDEPEDEHDGENEASERETKDAAEDPEEFASDDEDRAESNK